MAQSKVPYFNMPNDPKLLADMMLGAVPVGVVQGFMLSDDGTLSAGVLFTREGIRIEETAPQSLSIPDADPDNPRRDLVICRSEYEATSPAPSARFEVIAGTPAAEPATPDCTEDAIAIAECVLPAAASEWEETTEIHAPLMCKNAEVTGAYKRTIIDGSAPAMFAEYLVESGAIGIWMIPAGTVETGAEVAYADWGDPIFLLSASGISGYVKDSTFGVEHDTSTGKHETIEHTATAGGGLYLCWQTPNGLPDEAPYYYQRMYVDTTFGEIWITHNARWDAGESKWYPDATGAGRSTAIEMGICNWSVYAKDSSSDPWPYWGAASFGVSHVLNTTTLQDIQFQSADLGRLWITPKSATDDVQHRAYAYDGGLMLTVNAAYDGASGEFSKDVVNQESSMLLLRRGQMGVYIKAGSEIGGVPWEMDNWTRSYQFDADDAFATLANLVLTSLSVGEIKSNMIPDANLNRSLGSGDNRWQFAYVGELNAVSIKLSELQTLHRMLPAASANVANGTWTYDETTSRFIYAAAEGATIVFPVILPPGSQLHKVTVGVDCSAAERIKFMVFKQSTEGSSTTLEDSGGDSYWTNEFSSYERVYTYPLNHTVLANCTYWVRIELLASASNELVYDVDIEYKTDKSME